MVTVAIVVVGLAVFALGYVIGLFVGVSNANTDEEPEEEPAPGEEACAACAGTGRFDGHRCSSCDGSGNELVTVHRASSKERADERARRELFWPEFAVSVADVQKAVRDLTRPAPAVLDARAAETRYLLDFPHTELVLYCSGCEKVSPFGATENEAHKQGCTVGIMAEGVPRCVQCKWVYRRLPLRGGGIEVMERHAPDCPLRGEDREVIESATPGLDYFVGKNRAIREASKAPLPCGSVSTTNGDRCALPQRHEGRHSNRPATECGGHTWPRALPFACGCGAIAEEVENLAHEDGCPSVESRRTKYPRVAGPSKEGLWVCQECFGTGGKHSTIQHTLLCCYEGATNG